MPELDITVVLASWGAPNLLPIALAQLEHQTLSSSRYHILVQDFTGDERAEDLVRRYAEGSPVRIDWLACDSRNPAQGHNAAINKAEGRWLVFLDDSLLASPDLLEEHKAVQERHGGACAALGCIETYPDVANLTLTRWRELTQAHRILFNEQTMPYFGWRIANLSLPKKAVIDAGLFNEGLALPALEELELAQRLESSSITGIYAAKACAFIWQPSTIEAERRRKYLEGFSLAQLNEILEDKRLRASRLRRTAFGTRLACIFAPLCVVLIAQETALFRKCLELMLRKAWMDGYRDGEQGQLNSSYLQQPG